MGITAAIFGCKGLTLSAEETAFFTKTNPLGFILFARNVENPQQVRDLVAQLKACVTHDQVPVLIDQEGGRVQRLGPPHWPEYKCGRFFGKHFDHNEDRGKRLAWLQSRLIACDLLRLGINVDCLPVLDVPVPGSDGIIGDRAYSSNPHVVSALGSSAARGLMDGGVLPVVKHIPGHGRAMVDSHLELPCVDTSLDELRQTDFEPFRQLAHLPMAMTAHVVYTSVDGESPATTSPVVVREIIRGEIGFDGLLMSDDLSMQALTGDFCERTNSVFDAGCDVVLHCNGEMEEMLPISKAAPQLKGKPFERMIIALDKIGRAIEMDEISLRHEFDQLAGEEN